MRADIGERLCACLSAKASTGHRGRQHSRTKLPSHKLTQPNSDIKIEENYTLHIIAHDSGGV